MNQLFGERYGQEFPNMMNAFLMWVLIVKFTILHLAILARVIKITEQYLTVASRILHNNATKIL